MTQPPSSPKSDKNPGEASDFNQALPSEAILSERDERGKADAPSRRQIENKNALAYVSARHRRERSLKSKVALWSLAIGTIPALVLGITIFLSNQSLQSQLNRDGLEKEKIALESQIPFLWLGTITTALIAGTIAAISAERTLRPVLKAAKSSNHLVNRLLREEAKLRDRVAGKDELAALENNLSLIEEQLPDLIWKQEAEAERFQTLTKITYRLREARSQEEVMRLAVDAVRQAFRCDRVAIFRLEATGEGVFVEESVAPGWPKALWTNLHDPCFEGGYAQQYREGRVKAIDNIYTAGLGDCHIGLLERFAVKANLIAPIIKDNELYGLLIAHQCAGPRVWQPVEIDMFAQIAIQIGFAIDYTKVLEQLDSKFDRAQLFIDLTRRIRESIVEDDILQTTVEEVRKTLRCDRVVVYGFDPEWYGTVVAESVVPGFPKAIHARIKDPCFAEGYVEQYQAGRVQATSNIYEAGLTECYLQQLEPFAVKANLVAPILKDDKLFGLLIAHQCSAPRNWQQTEIDFFAQIATQVGFALDRARLVARMDAETVRTEQMAYLTRRIHESPSEERILKTTVEEIRKALKADRVVVYRFNADWGGYVAAESVLSGWTHAINYEIEDACIPESLRQAYLAGRVVPTNNVLEAGFHPDHLKLMEQLEIKANLVTPIVKENQLFGLLIAHQCSSSRNWQPPEIDLMAQLALQVGYALDRARLLDRAEQAYYQAEASARQERQQKESLLLQTTNLLKNSQKAVEILSNDAIHQMEVVTAAYNQIKSVTEMAQQIGDRARQIETQKQPMVETVAFSTEAIASIVKSTLELKESIVATTEQVKHLDRPSEKLVQGIDSISKIISQMKLQAMNAALEAARSGVAGQEFATIGDNVLALARQLEGDLAEIKPFVRDIQQQNQQVSTAIETSKDKTIAQSQIVGETQKKLQQVAASSDSLHELVSEIAQVAAKVAQNSASASQSVLTVANLASHASEQSMTAIESFNQLATIAHELQPDEKPKTKKDNDE
jgi:twitching motility protein PilJ